MPLHQRTDYGWALQERIQSGLPVGHDPQQGIGQSHGRPTHPDHDYRNFIGMKFVLIPPGEFLMGSMPGEIEAALAAAGKES